MIELLKQQEGAPEAYPEVAGLSAKAEALDAAAIWQRIEQWIAYRWGERPVTWTVRGRGEWLPPLDPFTIENVEQYGGLTWDTAGWRSAELVPSPMGLELTGGTYRIQATVGSPDDPPAVVLQAFTRLAEYLAEGDARAFSGYSRTLGDASENIERPVVWQARAIHYSGAADLLRPWHTV